MALQQDILLLQADYKRAKRCNDFISKRITLEEIGIPTVHTAIDAAQYILKYNNRVEALITQMYESCENRFMIDRVRLLKITRKSY